MRALAASAVMVCFASVAAAQQFNSTPDRLTVTVDVQKTMPPVSKYEYGMFTEHIRDTMYRALWAEMLDDRKFYFPITSAPDTAPRPQQGGGGGPRATVQRRWRPVGPDDAVSMDKQQPFVGDQSPRITLDASTPHGIRQAGLQLVKNKKYTGRVVLRAPAGAHVTVSLVWGPGERDRQVIHLPVSEAYKTFPLTFTSSSDTTEAALEISGTGSGNLHIGAVSLMPADNINGFRPDVIDLFRQINMGFWRYGGNYTSNLIWYHTIGDPDKRPPDWDNAWGAMQPNDLGMDEFMNFCKLIGVEAYISVNAGLGDSHSAAEEVEYINGSATTPMGALRAKNGHPAPYHVKFWNIGNEPWGSWQIGRTDTKYFMMKHNEFAKAMREVDPSITLIASGRMLQDDMLHGDDRKYVGNLQPLYGAPADWTGNFLSKTWGNFDGIAEHWYSHPGRRFDPAKLRTLAPDASDEDAYVKADQTLLESARSAGNVVLDKALEWESYQHRFPAMVDKHIFLSIDEYAFSGGGFGRGANLAGALEYGMILNEMLRHTGYLTMAAHTTGASMLDISRTGSTFSTIGLIFKLYSNHFVGAIPVALSGNSPQPPIQFPGGDQPTVNSGSPTYPLDIVAALSPDRKSLLLSVVNATASQQSFDLKVAGVHTTGTATLWVMTGPSPDASNHVGQPQQVEIKQNSVGAAKTLTVAPLTINLYQFPVVD
ncbi:MAG TPA: alpha-L-arabinofuranosidase C-terminal domain-containing protein [Acidobacteriaceae bacterium]|nr:alpha-L-arabinofuranosidase C-terminal domain-containing protein [Acidobacteriaceae bacterium]